MEGQISSTCLELNSILELLFLPLLLIRFYITHFPISSLLVLRKVTNITIIVANIYRVQWVRRWSTHLTTYLTHICIISLNPQAISLLFTEEATAGERLSVMLKVLVTELGFELRLGLLTTASVWHSQPDGPF